MRQTLVLAILLSLPLAAAAQPVKQLHPMIPPYPGSLEGQGLNVVAFNEWNMPKPW